MRIAYEYGDAVPQKTRRPPLVLLRTPTAKERFCRNTFAKAGGERGSGVPTLLQKNDLRK